jgi:hypothetical protein
MKKLIRILLIFILPPTCLYFIICFVKLSYDITEWSEFLRAVFVFMSIITSTGFYQIYLDMKDYNPKGDNKTQEKDYYGIGKK